VNIPCLGLCETSMHLACLMGESFGFVMISRKWSARVLENVRRSGLERRFAGAEPLDTSPLQLRYADARGREQIIARFSEASERLLEKGAEVIIPGGGDIIAYLVEAGIHEIGRAPILNGIIELVKMGETAVKLKALTGRFTSRHMSYATPTGEFLERIRGFYGPDVYPGAE
jgi:allantoin racemase